MLGHGHSKETAKSNKVVYQRGGIEGAAYPAGLGVGLAGGGGAHRSSNGIASSVASDAACEEHEMANSILSMGVQGWTTNVSPCKHQILKNIPVLACTLDRGTDTLHWSGQSCYLPCSKEMFDSPLHETRGEKTNNLRKKIHMLKEVTDAQTKCLQPTTLSLQHSTQTLPHMVMLHLVLYQFGSQKKGTVPCGGGPLP